MKGGQHTFQLMRVSGSKKRYLVFSIFFSMLSALSQMVPYATTYLLLAELMNTMTGSVTLEYSYIWSLVWISLGALVLSGISLFVGSMFAHVAAYDIIYHLRLKLTQKLSELPLGYHQVHSKGTLKGTVMTDTERLEGFIAHYLPDTVTAILFSTGVLTYLFILDWRLALFLLIPIGVAMFFQWFAFRNEKGKEIIDQFFNSIAQMNGTIVEYVQGLPVLKVFNQTVYSFQRFSRDVQAFHDYGKAYSIYSIPSFALLLVALPSAFVFIIPVGAILLANTDDYSYYVTIVFLFLLLSNGLFLPIYKLMYVGSRSRQIHKALAGITKILNEEVLPEGSHTKKPNSFDIQFDTVGFSYENKVALKDVSFYAKQGTVTALVGPSGAGKSTVAHLIARFWDVSSGSIKIGGMDVRDLKTEALYECLSIVFQDNYMYSDTIRNNIRLGNAQASDQDIERAAEAAQCHTFIQKLSDGYDTKVGSDGVHLSGGECQRIAIARLLLKDSPIVILDEATAYADAENELYIQQALNILLQHKTVLIIAHRLPTIQQADQIIVLDQGEIEEKGTHTQLIAQEGLYATLWRLNEEGHKWTLKTGKGKAL